MICLQRSAPIPPRTSPIKFDHLAEKSNKITVLYHLSSAASVYCCLSVCLSVLVGLLVSVSISVCLMLITFTSISVYFFNMLINLHRKGSGISHHKGFAARSPRMSPRSLIVSGFQQLRASVGGMDENGRAGRKE